MSRDSRGRPARARGGWRGPIPACATTTWRTAFLPDVDARGAGRVGALLSGSVAVALAARPATLELNSPDVRKASGGWRTEFSLHGVIATKGDFHVLEGAPG